MIRLNVFIKVSAENRKEVLEAAKRLTEASRQQIGCIAYDIFESATRPDVLMICETWHDNGALDAHTESEIYKKESPILRQKGELKLESFNF